MNFDKKHGLYAITNNDDSLDTVRSVIASGTAVLQYREKNSPSLQHALSLKELCTQAKIPLIINDDDELAKQVNADGVHLGENDNSFSKARELLGDDKIIGVTCYDNLDYAIEAEQLGAGYVAFGSFFSSKTKLTTRHASLELLIKAREKLTIPIVAIGGITPENGQSLIDAGADYLAVIHGIFGQNDPARATQKFVQLFK